MSEAAATIPILVDCDTGIDDSLALLYAAASPECELVAVTCTAGNVDARQVAEMYGTRHTEFVVEASMAAVLEKLVRHYGEPYADPSALPSYFVSRETRKSVTVALNGDGGDENFGGYMRYVAMKLAWYFTALPPAVKKSALAMMSLLPEKTAPFNTVFRARKFLRATLSGALPSRYLSTVSFFKTDEDLVAFIERDTQP